MGAVHGFLGGVLLTSSVAYFTGQYVRDRARVVSRHLSDAERTIHNRILSDADLVREARPRDSHARYLRRAGVAEACKDIWNEEIITMVNWLYSLNWYRFGLLLDHKLAGLGAKVWAELRDK